MTNACDVLHVLDKINDIHCSRCATELKSVKHTPQQLKKNCTHWGQPTGETRVSGLLFETDNTPLTESGEDSKKIGQKSGVLSLSIDVVSKSFEEKQKFFRHSEEHIPLLAAQKTLIVEQRSVTRNSEIK